MEVFAALIGVISFIVLVFSLQGLRSKEIAQEQATYRRRHEFLNPDKSTGDETEEEAEPEVKEQEKRPSPLWNRSSLTEKEKEERDRRWDEVIEQRRPFWEEQRKKDKPAWLKFKKVYPVVEQFLYFLDSFTKKPRACDCSKVIYLGTHYNCDSIAHAILCVKCRKKTDWTIMQIQYIFREQYEKYMRAMRPEPIEPEPEKEEKIIKPYGYNIKVIFPPRNKKKKKRVQNISEQSRTEQKKENIPSLNLDEVRKIIGQKGGPLGKEEKKQLRH